MLIGLFFLLKECKIQRSVQGAHGTSETGSVKWWAVCSQVAASILGEVCNVLQTELESFSEAVFGSFCWFLDLCQSF